MNNVTLVKKLKKLVIANSVSGYEWEMGITDVIKTFAGDNSFRIEDSLIYKFGSRGKRIFISAHMDEVGFFITESEENSSFVVPIGDISVKEIAGARLCFRQNEINRLSLPLMKRASFDKLMVVGGSNLPKGTVGTFEKVFKVEKNEIISPSLDNKVGCLVLIELINYFRTNKTNNQFYFCFSPREEVGTNGLMSAVKKLKPDICIDVDSAYSKPVQKEKKNWSIPIIGKGPAIQLQGNGFITRSNNRRFVERICDKYKIDYQYEIPEGTAGGTNSSILAAAGYNFFQINIPVANQHTAVSKASIQDVEKTIFLLKKLLLEL